MNKLILIFLFAVSTLISMAQTLNSMDQKDAKSVFWCSTGCIGKIPVTMYLLQNGPNGYHQGTYYYNSVMQPIEFFGQDSSGYLILDAYYGLHSEKFIGKISDNTFSGTWSSDKKKLTFELHQDSNTARYFEWVSLSDKRFLNEHEDSPYASYYEGASFPLATFDLAPLIRKTMFNKAENVDDYKVSLQKNKQIFLEQFYSENEKTEKEDAGYMGTREDMSYSLPVFLDENIAVFLSSYYNYLGGAHGMSATQYYVFDRLNKTVIPLENILQNKDDEKLQGIIYANFVKKYGKENAGMLFEKTKLLPATNNYYITPGGICFAYAEYEIGPYCMGNVSVTIPLSDINEYLTPFAKATLLR